MSTVRVPVVPPSTDFTDWCAREILRRHDTQLPDLGRVILLLPAWSGAGALRRSLSRHAGRPLLGPGIHLLRDFATARATDGPVLAPLECRLMLGVALRRHPGLIPAGSDATRVADGLFSLFEELAANAVEVPRDEAAFVEALQAAYGCGARSWLSAEAQLVFRLWQAFLADSNRRSPATVHRHRLAEALSGIAADEHVYLLGFDDFSTAESKAVGRALSAGKVTVWLHGRVDGRDGESLRGLLERLDAEPAPVTGTPNGRSRLLDQAFGTEPGTADEPDVEGVRVVEAASAEAEARVVDLAVREAVAGGCRDVVVLTQDRRLARRLRALLERAGLPLQDPVGWALSTSSAAALVDAWFECVEQNFHFRPLLEVLKSGFVEASASGLEYLERELIFRRKLERGLDRLLAAAHAHGGLRETLERAIGAARAFPRGDRTRPAHQWTGDLLQVLRELGAEPRLRADAAGQKLLALLEQLQGAFKRHSIGLDFDGFRDVLSRAIEAETFVPDPSPGPVRLMTLEQSQNLRCEVLIVAGASRDLLPGGVPAQPFLNQSVRAELRLPAWPAQLAAGVTRFRRVLEAAPQVLLTYSSEDVHDAAQPSPWLEALEAQARRCGLDLRDTRLPRLAGTAEVEIAEESDAPGATHRPAPIAAAKNLPTEISASGHQSLVDCPYQFHARYVLGLHEPEAPDQDPERRDYGEKVHVILRAFTEQVDDLPPPFSEAVTDANREDARRRLAEIAAAVFGPELQRRALALSWQAEFNDAIEPFLDWLQRRQGIVQVQTEIELREAVGDVGIKGKLDRLEVLGDGSKVVVDYKTGRVPRKKAVESGESIQLLHYAGLDPRIVAAELMPLKAGEPGVVLDEQLPELRRSAERRLQNLFQAARAGAGLPANGDDGVCRYCDYQGLCRKGDWVDD